MRVHFVSVTICQGKDFNHKADPYVKVEVSGATSRYARTKVRTNKASPIWNQKFDFTFKEDLDQKEGNRPTKVIFHALDKEHLSKDNPLGMAVIELNDYWKIGEKERGKYQWVVLLGADGKPTGGQLQVQVAANTLGEDKNKAMIEYVQYTHLLRVVVKQGSDLVSKDLVGKGDPYVELRLGDTICRTIVAEGSKNPVWNQTTYFWLNKPEQVTHDIVVGVFDQDKVGRDLIGEGLVTLMGLFEAMGDEMQWTSEPHWVDLKKVATHDDAQLTNEKAQMSKHGSQKMFSPPIADGDRSGRVQLVFELRQREQLERDFFQAAVAHVNATLNKEDMSEEDAKTLSKSDVAWILTTMGSNISNEEMDFVFAEMDANGNGVIDQEEFAKFMSSTRAQTSFSFKQLLKILANSEDGVVEGALMAPVEFAKQEGMLLIKDYETGVIVTEEIPVYIKAGIKAMSCSGVSRAFIAKSRKFMIKVSVAAGKKFDDPKSIRSIPEFIKTHHIQVEDLELPVESFKTFNDFFSRRLKPTARLIAEPDNEAVAVSPADCRMTAFQTTAHAQDVWIKGKHFTMESLLGPLAGEYASMFTNGSLVIARLAPQDYHCFHIPVSGVVGKEAAILDGALYTVNPIAVNHDVNVYTENKRCLVPIHTKEFGTVMLVVVGALMVGSWVLELQEGDKPPKGTRHGGFRYGGSTVLVLFQPGTIELNPRLITNTDDKYETLVRMGTFLGKATGKPGFNKLTNTGPSASSSAKNDVVNPATDSCCVLL